MDELHKEIIEYFNIIKGTEKDILPKNIFEIDNELFILHGRYTDRGRHHQFNNDLFCKGNAIDIIGHYLTHQDPYDFSCKKEDIYSCFGRDDKRRRYLEIFNKTSPQNIDIRDHFAYIKYVYKDGIYVPELNKISPEKIELIEITKNRSLDILKKKDSFKDIASSILGNQKGNELAERHFD